MQSEENSRKTLVLKKGEFITENWKNIQVGDIIKVKKMKKNKDSK